jgi:hypothetical protein
LVQATRSASVALVAATLASLLGCGSPNAKQAIAVRVSPASASVQASATQVFTASVTGAANTSASWSIAEGSSGGAITPAGVYTAPVSPGTYHVVAASAADPSATATAVVTVTAAPPPPVRSVAVNPISASVAIGATQVFAAQVNGAASDAIAWTVSAGGAGGTIDPSGLYTAPARAGTDAVIAISTVDPSKSATATVTVIGPAPTGLSYSPYSVVCTLGVVCAIAAPASGGGAVVSYAVSPALPLGLAMNASTGAIAGTPTMTQASSIYQVTASNAWGAATTALLIAVHDMPPSSLAYSPGSITCTLATPCASAVPTSLGGTVISYSVSATLPAGLVLNASTGKISGTPTALASTANYRVTAVNSGGSTTANFGLTVIDVAPRSLIYSPSTLTCAVGTPCALAAPTSAGGAVVSYAIAPSLPTGLALDSRTGAISGTPTLGYAAANYVVTATNSAGSTQTTLSIAVTTPIGPPGHTAVHRCDGFVYLDDGAFMLNGQPFPLKSANFHFGLLAKTVHPGDPPAYDSPRITQDGVQYDLAVQMDANYAPTGNFCPDKDSCEAEMAAQVANLQALGINSVRLMVDHSLFGNGDPASLIPDGDQQDLFFRTEPWAWNFMLDMSNPNTMEAILLLEKRAVQFLGARGIRSLMLLTGTPYMARDYAANDAFTSYLSKLSATMADEPYLIGYDFDNEPTWASGAPAGSSFSISKDQTRALVQSWVDAVRTTNSHALTTIGNAFTMTSVDTWDPQFAPIDFASYHVYPEAPMNWAHDADFVQRETYFVKLNSCGSVCPAGTRLDGANCHVLDGFPGTVGAAQNGQFQSTDSGGHTSVVGSYETGYDQPVVSSRPFFYVQPHGTTCPPGTQPDGANCLVATGPVGATGFIYGQSFYYPYLSPTQHCAPPATDDTANCNLAPIPAGYTGFVLPGAVFFVAARHCGVNGRKPAIIGEFGMSTSDLDQNTGAVLRANDGSALQQAEWLTNVATRAYNCGYQGIQWWEYEDEQWAFPDHFGMWGFWKMVRPGQAPPTPDAVAMRPSGNAMAALDPTALLQGSCTAPADFTTPHFSGDYAGGSGYSYSGTVSDANGNPMPFALVLGLLVNGPSFFLNTDINGKWSMSTPRLINWVYATQYGYETSGRHYPVPLVSSSIELTAGNLPAYNPPSSNDQACREVVY